MRFRSLFGSVCSVEDCLNLLLSGVLRVCLDVDRRSDTVVHGSLSSVTSGCCSLSDNPTLPKFRMLVQHFFQPPIFLSKRDFSITTGSFLPRNCGRVLIACVPQALWRAPDLSRRDSTAKHGV